MSSPVYRYSFDTEVPFEEVEAALVLALFSVESLHGEPSARLQAGHFLDRNERALVIDASSAVGLDLCKVFTGFLNREVGPDRFAIVRLNSPSTRRQEAGE